MSTIINIVLLILVIGVLTFVHELGHFLAAKLVKAKVEDFSLGFGPKILSKKIRGVTYNIRLFPLGGFVKILGDGDPTKEKGNKRDKGSLKNKTKLQQMFVMLAGVTMNILLAVFFYTIFLANSNWKIAISHEYEDFGPIGATITKEKVSDINYMLADKGGAFDANMYEQGYLISVNEIVVDSFEDLKEILINNSSQQVDIYACNFDDECQTFKVFVDAEGIIGIFTDVNYQVYIDYSTNKLFSGFSHSLNILKLTGIVFSSMFSEAKQTGDYSELSNTVSGPVGIYFAIDYFKTLGLIVFLGIVADLSLSLAIINLLPIPALDGGRFLILLIESIIRKDINPKIEELIINISFGLLVVLIVIIMIKDIINIERLQFFFS
jgi:regulator of sigma E protease